MELARCHSPSMQPQHHQLPKSANTKSSSPWPRLSCFFLVDASEDPELLHSRKTSRSMVSVVSDRTVSVSLFLQSEAGNNSSWAKSSSNQSVSDAATSFALVPTWTWVPALHISPRVIKAELGCCARSSAFGPAHVPALDVATRASSVFPTVEQPYFSCRQQPCDVLGQRRAL